MSSASGLPTGRTVQCGFGPFTPILGFLAADTLEITIPTQDGDDVQRVEIAPVGLRGGLLMLSWTERDGTVVVHVHDYDTMQVHSHARLTDGTLIRAAGTLVWVE